MDSLHKNAKRIIGLLGIMVVLAFCAYLLSGERAAIVPATTTSTSPSTPPPAPSAEVLAQLKASKGAQELVSYTDRGFEPTSTTIKVGDTVRFINNSGENLWVASSGTDTTSVYPADSKGQCGQSAFDSCRAMKHGEFWEFTFTQAGTWSYKNNADTKMTGVVKVSR